jgi:undecaprenyl-diphosphatase
MLCVAIVVLIATVGPQFHGDREIPFDIAFLKWLHQIIPDSFAPFFRLTYKGTGVALTAVLVALSLSVLAWKRRWLEAQYLALATLGILLIIDQALKPLFNRRRPLESLVEVDGRSFPSGHAAGSVVFYFYIAFLLAAHFPQYRRYIFLGATIWVGLIGLSSMYCRVHWASDIVAGYAVGYVWLTVTLALLKRADPKTYYYDYYGKPSALTPEPRLELPPTEQ